MVGFAVTLVLQFISARFILVPDDNGHELCRER